MILLTGAAGFIGSNILKALNAQGREDILCVDDLTDGRKVANLAGTKYEYYCDWRDIGKGKTREFTLDAVIHQGAISDTTGANGREMMLANYSFSIDLLDLASKFNAPFIYASSAAVYGRGTSAPFKEDKPASNLTSPYAYSKLAFDEYAMKHRRVATGDPVYSYRNHKIVGLRYFNVYGPGEAHKGKMASVAYQLIQQVKAGQDGTLFDGSKDIFRDFVYIDDVVQVVLWAMEKEAPAGIYNVGTGTARSFYDVHRAVMAAAVIATHRSQPKFIPMPEELRAQYQFYTCADLTQLRAAGYQKDFTDLETGIRKYWASL